MAYDQKVEVESWWKEFAKKHKIASNALFFIKDYHRSYPYGSMLGQILHTVRESKEPTGGLELYFDQTLRGFPGKRELLRSPYTPMDNDTILKDPQDGQNIELTIDPTLQAICEEEIERAVEQVKAKGGWAVMMEPHTGEIMALAQYPFFEPANFFQYYNDSNRVEHTKAKALTDCFEPGSTMKPVTLAMALLANQELLARGEAPLFDPEEKIRSDDGRILGTRHRIRDVSTHKFLNMKLALVKSSNIYMGILTQRIVERLGAKWYRDQLQEVFGFGVKTQIQLPCEAHGMVPAPGKFYKGGRPQWSKPTPYTLAIGYNLLATSLQMVRAYAFIANGGYTVYPTLIPKPQEKKTRILSRELSRDLIDAMKCVTKPGGSSVRADIPGYTEAGKSGTAEKVIDGKYSKTVHFASFVGFAPAHNASFVLFIGIDEPEYRRIPGYGMVHYGGKCAARTFLNIGRRALHHLGVPPDDPYGYPAGDPRSNPERADSLKEARRLKTLYDQWNHSP